MYELNDVLVYGNSGVCRLVDIRKEQFSGTPTMYYILSPVFNGQSMLYVPIENTALSSKLRPVMMKETLHEMMLKAKSNDVSWENDDRLRSEKFQDVLSHGLSEELLSVMKSLVIHKNELKKTIKKLHSADERTLNLCEKIVGEEFAFAFGVDLQDALSHIESELSEAA